MLGELQIDLRSSVLKKVDIQKIYKNFTIGTFELLCKIVCPAKDFMQTLSLIEEIKCLDIYEQVKSSKNIIFSLVYIFFPKSSATSV